MTKSIVLVAVMGVAWLGCSARADVATEESALLEADRAFARAVADSGANGWTAYFASDGVMFRPGGTVIGSDSIRAMATAWFADDTFSLTWGPTHAEVSPEGTLGYTYGRYQSSGTDSAGNPIISTGSYLTVWRKQPDGSWKVAADIGSPDR